MGEDVKKDKEEQAFFRFTTHMMKQEIDFKLKVYPSLGFSIIIPFLLLYSGTDINLHELSNSSSYFTIYFTMINIPTIFLALKYSGKYKGAWIFTIFPIHDYAIYYKASIKSILIYLFMPIYFLIAVIFLFLFGIRILPDLIAVLLSAFLYAVVCFLLTERTLPFSEPIKTANTEGWKAMLLLLFILLFAAIHFGSTFLPYGIYIYCLVLLIVNFIAWTMAFKKKEMVI